MNSPNRSRFIVVGLSIMLLLVSCSEKSTDVSNNIEIQKLLGRYMKMTKKYRASKFIADNIKGHKALHGETIDIFRESLLKINADIDSPNAHVVDSLWRSALSIQNGVSLESHLDIITADYLINDIDAAFDIWNNSEWKDSISFKVFKDYILPYSIMSEPITAWRKILHDKYKHIIVGIVSPKEAFDKVYTYVRDNFKLSETESSYIMDPIIINKTMRGSCAVRSLYIVAVMRSLCIPVAYDFSTAWANYGKNNASHSWVAYIGNGKEIYTMYDYDSVSYKNGIIDGTIWKRGAYFDDSNTSYNVDSLKKIPKIWRKTYAHSDKNGHLSFQNEKFRDVSALYNYNNSIRISVDDRIKDDAYVCVFRSGEGWIPIDVVKPKGGTIKFNNLGGDITYLLTYKDEYGEIEPLTNPITVYSNGKKELRDPETETEQVILRRKYPLLTLWAPIRWKEFIGFTFEGSNAPDFTITDTLYIVKDIPMWKTYAEINTDKTYRYIRFKGRRGIRRSFTEIAFYGLNEMGEEVKLDGTIIYRNMEYERAEMYFDGDYFNGGSVKYTYSWVGLDLGENNKIKLSQIMYCPWNDGNFIDIGDEYELLYYNMGWRSLGKKNAESENIVYDNVPKNALLWLRNLTKGKEERIFTYENNKQVWW